MLTLDNVKSLTLAEIHRLAVSTPDGTTVDIKVLRRVLDAAIELRAHRVSTEEQSARRNDEDDIEDYVDSELASMRISISRLSSRVSAIEKTQSGGR